MGGTSKSSSDTQSSQQTTPYAPAAAGLQGILGGLNPSIATAGGTPQTAGAFDQLYANAAQGNPYASGIGSATAGQLGGAQNYGNATGILNNAYGNLQSQLSPYTSGNAMDPSSNPALAQQLATVNADVSGQVNPMFAAAGRLASPDNYQALARGITQGSTGILQNAASNQLSAANSVYGAGANTAGGLLGADTANANIQNSGINNTAAALAAPNYGATQALGIANAQQNMPVSNYAQLAGILGPLAGMFGTQTGTSSTQGTQTASPAAQAMGWINAFSGLANASKSGGNAGSFPFQQ